MSTAELATLQVKLTYVGEIGSGGSSILIGSSAGSLNVALFAPFSRSEFLYIDDALRMRTVIVSTQILKAIIDSVGAVPGVTDGDVDAGGDVSFSLCNTAGGTKVFEAVVDTANGRALFGKLVGALRTTPAAVRTIRAFGCGLGMLPDAAPANVTGSVQLNAGGLRVDRKGEFVGRVKLTNTSGQALATPILLVLRMNADATLVEGIGTTCNLGRPGDQFLELPVTGSLPNGGSVETTIHIRNPGGTKLGITYEVYAGAGTP